ncbi:MAG: lycopene cyclase domain-containing protein [Spirochaetia bacterium]|nr:lycopene cyclase domain-containing protein [Spirochaetia bacterium]
MNLYLTIIFAVIAAPLALSFDKRVAFHRKWKQLGISMLPVAVVYIGWDIWATWRGDWHFSSEYAGSWRMLGLPLGEWLFFFVVPYACIFIWEVAKAYFPLKTHHNRTAVNAIGVLAILLSLLSAIIFRRQEYTVLALLSFAAWIAAALRFKPELFHQSHTLWFFALSTVAFLLVNGILTGVPIVLYNPEAIGNIRIITIPIEDLLYNIGMLGFYLLSYETMGRRLA